MGLEKINEYKKRIGLTIHFIPAPRANGKPVPAATPIAAPPKRTQYSTKNIVSSSGAVMQSEHRFA